MRFLEEFLITDSKCYYPNSFDVSYTKFSKLYLTAAIIYVTLWR